MGVTEKREKVSIGTVPGGKVEFDDSIRSLSRISGLEPTIVMVPPRMAQKPIGMSSLEIGRFPRLAIRETTGKNNAAAPMFCIKLEITPTVTEITLITRPSASPPYFRIFPATWLMTPVLSRPAPMIMTAIIEITALLEYPSNKCSSGTSPL